MGATTPDPLARLKALQRSSALRSVPPASTVLEPIAGDGSDCSDWVARALGAEVTRNRFGEYLTTSRWFADPAETEMGAGALRLAWPDVPELALDPHQWLFLDTETTGLAGGTGTYPFLVGIAWWESGGIQVEQFFMRDLNEEWPVLSALADRLEQRPVLVTFNGKSFDWPLLETRYCMTRTIDLPRPGAHLDFLHPARNIWRLRLGSVRLAELERQVLGWDRGEDLVSDLIPQIYVEFLRGGSPEPLIPILRHNQMDLRGLAALSSRVLSLLTDPEANEADALDVFGLSRIHERRGQLGRARELYQCSIAASLPAQVEGAARVSVARLAKRDGDYEVALAHWKAALGGSKEGLNAYEQLAIYYEHRARELQPALEVTRQALAELRRAHRLGTIAGPKYRQCKARFDHRLARLERKTRLLAGAGLFPGQ